MRCPHVIVVLSVGHVFALTLEEVYMILSEFGYKAFIYLFILAAPCGLWDLSSPTRDQTHAPCSRSMEF